MIDPGSHGIRFRFVDFTISVNAPNELWECSEEKIAEHPVHNSLLNQCASLFQSHNPEKITERFCRSRIRPFKAIIGRVPLMVAATGISDSHREPGSFVLSEPVGRSNPSLRVVSRPFHDLQTTL
jgi:hypothetical protein